MYMAGLKQQEPLDLLDLEFIKVSRDGAARTLATWQHHQSTLRLAR